MNPDELTLDEMNRMVEQATRRDFLQIYRAFAGMGAALGGVSSAATAALSAADMRVLADVIGDAPPAVAPAHASVTDMVAEAAATLDALAPPLRAIVTWPDGERQEWAIPAGERAKVEAALRASGAAYTIEGGAGR